MYLNQQKLFVIEIFWTMSATSKPLVVITGVSGYLGSHVCLQFLKDGSYRVRGTVRSTSNEAKIKPLKE
eukprot:Awhi_evm1s4020